jgi:hypothetical protein
MVVLSVTPRKYARYNIALVDSLPAVFEIVNTALKTMNPTGNDDKKTEPEWYQQRVRSKKDYNDFIDLAYAKQAFPHLGVGTGGKRKRTRRIKKNGKFSTSRRRLRTKNGNRKNSRSNRKK